MTRLYAPRQQVATDLDQRELRGALLRQRRVQQQLVAQAGPRLRA